MMEKLLIQFATFKWLSYCCDKTIGFNVKTSFARSQVSYLIKPGDIAKVFLIKGYSVPREFSWIENYKSNTSAFLLWCVELINNFS